MDVDASSRTDLALQKVFIPLCVSDMGERERATRSTALYTPFLDLPVKHQKGAETALSDHCSARSNSSLLDIFFLEAHLSPDSL